MHPAPLVLDILIPEVVPGVPIVNDHLEGHPVVSVWFVGGELLGPVIVTPVPVAMIG